MMLMLLSPAKKLDFDHPVRTTHQSDPVFADEARALIGVLRQYTQADLAALMKLSEPLARLNVTRYADWVDAPDARQARPAALAFNGDVYAGLRAHALDDEALLWAQRHLVILSGLYGVLGPLDGIQPHRLEMGTRLPTSRGATLYAFWGDRIAHELNRRLDALSGDRVVLNLASAEYFRSVDQEALSGRVVECVFEDEKNGDWKVIGLHAKRARGRMARYVIDHRLTQVAALEAFAETGYRFAKPVSTPSRLVFRRSASALAAVKARRA